jgi:transglutaminase-like putative cysteine protease
MQMLVSIQHVMDLTYSGPISEFTLDLRLAPRSNEHQTLCDFKFVAGHQARVFEYSDWQGNRVHHVSIGCSHDRAIIVANSHVDIHPQQRKLEQYDDSAPISTRAHQYQDYLVPHGPVQFEPRLEVFIREMCRNRELRAHQVLAAIVTQMCTLLKFNKDAQECGERSVAEVVKRGKGNAKDCAHVALSLLRYVGIPARYVSGYLFRRGMMELELHSWVEAFTPSTGWIGVDPTQGKVIEDAHIALAIGRCDRDVAPQRGAFLGNAQQVVKLSLRGTDLSVNRNTEWFRSPRLDNERVIES